MKSSLFQSVCAVLGCVLVASVLCYGVVQLTELLQEFSSEMSRYEAWMASGMGR